MYTKYGYFLGWSRGDGTGHEAYRIEDYFRGDPSLTSSFLGPDMHGIEPLFSRCPRTGNVLDHLTENHSVDCDCEPRASR